MSELFDKVFKKMGDNHKLTRHQQYALDLHYTHGIEKAIEMVEESLKRCKSSSAAQLTMFGEADFHINNNGQYVYSKVQTEKTAKVKEKRIKANIDFYATVLNILKAHRT